MKRSPPWQVASDATMLALQSFAWLLGEQARADRFLALTGLDPADLRARIAEPALQAAVIAFLEAHEPDLIACAAAIGVEPQILVQAGRELTA